MGWPITSRVFSCHAYASLPDRRIVFSPFPRRRIVSFGTIVYCSESQRWLLVRTRRSYAFNVIMSGQFQKCDVPVIMSYLTQDELTILKQMSHGRTSWRLHNAGVHLDAEGRFAEQWDLIKPYLTRLTPTDLATTTPWTFPKGRLEHHEVPYRCALREFEEESGLPSTLLGVPSFPDPIGESYVSFDHYIYETKCWVFCLPSTVAEPALSQPTNVNEIAERRWCTTDEARALLSPSKYAMLLQAKSRIDSEILTPQLPKPTYLPNYGEHHIPIQPEEPVRPAPEEPHREG